MRLYKHCWLWLIGYSRHGESSNFGSTAQSSNNINMFIDLLCLFISTSIYRRAWCLFLWVLANITNILWSRTLPVIQYLFLTCLSKFLHFCFHHFMFPAIYNMFTSDCHMIWLSKSSRLIHELTNNITSISLFHLQYGPNVFGPYWICFIGCFYILTVSWTNNWNSLSRLTLCPFGGNFTSGICLILKFLLLVVMLLCITIKMIFFALS